MVVTLFGCRVIYNEPENNSVEESSQKPETFLLYETEEDYWYAAIVKTGILISDTIQLVMPHIGEDIFQLPTREQATILKNQIYTHKERFLTNDGYTFAMPSEKISKAGSKTKYTAMAIFVQPKTIDIQW